MRLATATLSSGPRACLIAADGTLVPVDEAVSGAPRDMLGVLDAGSALWDRLRAAAVTAKGGTALAGATLLAPIPRPRRNVVCVGLNYKDHVAESTSAKRTPVVPSDGKQPQWPALFSKQPATVIGPGAAILHSAPSSDQLDWEVELAAVIGTPGKDIAEDRALSHVFGYTIANDISVRDIQMRHAGQWFKGKNFDTHLPLGPWIVTADEFGEPNRGEGRTLRLRVNGVQKQESQTGLMIFTVARIVSEVSRGMALEPGDVIITGTPSGVGFARIPPEFLKVGDVVEAEIEGIGVLRNTVAAAQP